MQFDLGFQGLAILLALAVVVGIVAQFVGGADTPWAGLIAGAASFVGGLFVSEVMFAGATEAEIQPVIDGLAFDEAMLGTIVVGVVVTFLTRYFARGANINRQHPA
jgi:phosphatidylserine synthase